MASDTASNQEPTMEEILASIRRIISEDGDEEKPEGAEEAAAEGESAPEVEAEAEAEAAPVEAAAEPATEVVAEAAPEEDLPVEEVDDEAMALAMAAAMAEEQGEQPEEIIELTDIVPEVEPAPAEAIIEDDLMMVDREDEPPLVPAPAPTLAPVDVEPPSPLLTDRVQEQAAGAFMQLSRSVLVSESEPRSLEHLVQEMLRPVLQDWLNANLPTIVENLVQQEIDRVSRRGR